MIIGILEVKRNEGDEASVKSIILKNDIQHVKAVLGTDDSGKTFYSKELIIMADKKDYTIELDKNTSFVVYHGADKTDETNDVDVVRQAIANILLEHDETVGY